MPRIKKRKPLNLVAEGLEDVLLKTESQTFRVKYYLCEYFMLQKTDKLYRIENIGMLQPKKNATKKVNQT